MAPVERDRTVLSSVSPRDTGLANPPKARQNRAMSRVKPYGLNCPISSSLDLLGNRWAMLVLRQLHAGPASFAQIKTGLTGIATNMLSARLSELCDAGMVQKQDRIYALTETGQATRAILFELARFGRTRPLAEHTDKPRTVEQHAVVLAGAIERAAGPLDDLRAEILLNGTPFALMVSAGRAALTKGAMPLAPVRLGFAWEDLEMVAKGDQRLSQFAEQSQIAANDPLQVAALLDLLQKAMDIYGGFR